MGKISVEDDKMCKISLPGYDVDSATPEQCAYHSGFTYEFIKNGLEGYITYTSPNPIVANTTYTVATITHNLGYVPEFQVFMSEPFWGFANTFAELPYSYDASLGYVAKVSTTELKILLVYTGDINITDPAVGPIGKDYGFKYQIFVNQLNPS